MIPLTWVIQNRQISGDWKEISGFLALVQWGGGWGSRSRWTMTANSIWGFLLRVITFLTLGDGDDCTALGIYYNHWIVHFKWVTWKVWEFYLRKYIFFNNKKKKKEERNWELHARVSRSNLGFKKGIILIRDPAQVRRLPSHLIDPQRRGWARAVLDWFISQGEQWLTHCSTAIWTEFCPSVPTHFLLCFYFSSSFSR